MYVNEWYTRVDWRQRVRRRRRRRDAPTHLKTPAYAVAGVIALIIVAVQVPA
jgi:hypothetical protein